MPSSTITRLSLATIFLAAACLAQESITRTADDSPELGFELPIFGHEGHDLDDIQASIVGVFSDGRAVMTLACGSSYQNTDDCLLWPYPTLTVGATSYTIDYDSVTTEVCELANDLYVAATCTVSTKGVDTESRTYEILNQATQTATITVTAGLERLSSTLSETQSSDEYEATEVSDSSETTDWQIPLVSNTGAAASINAIAGSSTSANPRSATGRPSSGVADATARGSRWIYGVAGLFGWLLT